DLLGADANVKEYLRLVNQTQQDRKTAELEIRYEQLYQELSMREQNGEPLTQTQIDAYYDLKRQVEENPLIAAREAQLETVKAIFVETAEQMKAVLGIDYPAFIR
ncbi:MAG TPA: YlbF family regulator, partial [Anaerolineaceae bacterium]|nr:YlbF family regulator [Anaerolineaceae bacterium]